LLTAPSQFTRLFRSLAAEVVVINSEALQERSVEPADYVATVDSA
jgi:hypothetical protein